MKSLLPGHKSGLPSAEALDSEQLRIDAALAHIQEHGNLDDYPGDRNERRAIMITAVRRGLVAWDRWRERYRLTGAGRSQIAGLEAVTARIASPVPGAPVQDGPVAEAEAAAESPQWDLPDDLPAAPLPAAELPAAGRREGRRAVIAAAVVALAVGTGIGGLMASSRLFPGSGQTSANVAEVDAHPATGTTAAATPEASGTSAPARANTGGPQTAAAKTPPTEGVSAGSTGAPAASQDKAAVGATDPHALPMAQSTGEAKSAEATGSTPDHREGTSVAAQRSAEGDQAVAAAPSTAPADAVRSGTSTRHHRRARANRRDDYRQDMARQDGFWGPSPGALSYDGRDGVEGRSFRSRRDAPAWMRRSERDREAMESHKGGGRFGTDPVFGWLFR